MFNVYVKCDIIIKFIISLTASGYTGSNKQLKSLLSSTH